MALTVKLKRALQATGQSDEEGVLCINCDKSFANESDTLMNCDYCKSWICTRCLTMSSAEYKHHVHTASSGMWFCAPCKTKITKFIDESKTVEEKCSNFLKNYTERLEKLEKKLEEQCVKVEIEGLIEEKIAENNDSLKDEISKKSDKQVVEKLIQDKLKVNDIKLKTYNEELGKKIETANKAAEEAKSSVVSSNNEIVDKTVQKLNEQNERANNIVIFNLEESEAILKNVCAEHDRELVNTLLKVVLPTANPDETFLEMPVRMGSKRTDKIRPIKIKFKHIDYKQAFLLNMRNMEMTDNETLKKCSVTHDLNEHERIHERSLVVEMKRLNQGQHDFLYRVRGPAHDRRLVKMKK